MPGRKYIKKMEHEPPVKGESTPKAASGPPEDDPQIPAQLEKEFRDGEKVLALVSENTSDEEKEGERRKRHRKSPPAEEALREKEAQISVLRKALKEATRCDDL